VYAGANVAEEDPYQLCMFERRFLSSAQVLFTLFFLPPFSSLHFLFPIPNPSILQVFFFRFFFFWYFHLVWSVTFALFGFYFWVFWVTRFQGLLGCKVVIFRFYLGICHLGSWEGRRRWYLELMISGFGCLGTARDGLGCWEW